ncbi:MAG: transposase [Bacteroidales bacterium]|nr:transposase [Bacteroidales bacterium]
MEAGLYRERLTKAGAKPYDYVLMFKILVLQRMYNLSDEQAEYQMKDRVIGFARNAARNTLTNLVYNVCRYEQIVRLGMN